MDNLKTVSLALLLIVGVALIVSSVSPQSKRSYLRFLGVAFLMIAGGQITNNYAAASPLSLYFTILALLAFFVALYESIVVTREKLRQMHLRQQAREVALGEVLKTIAENTPEETETKELHDNNR